MRAMAGARRALAAGVRHGAAKPQLVRARCVAPARCVSCSWRFFGDALLKDSASGRGGCLAPPRRVEPAHDLGLAFGVLSLRRLVESSRPRSFRCLSISSARRAPHATGCGERALEKRRLSPNASNPKPQMIVRDGGAEPLHLASSSSGGCAPCPGRVESSVACVVDRICFHACGGEA